MAENKDQHYVPKMLMKGFANPNHSFCLAFRNKKCLKTILDIPYDHQCQYDYYYGRDKEWEKLLGQIENDTAPIFEKIRNDSSFYPNDIEISKIKEFIVAQRARTPRMIDWQKENLRRQEYELAKMFLKSTYLTENEKKIIDSKYDKQNEENAKKIMRSVSFRSKYISDLELLLVHFNSNEKLILSDDPVILLNPFLHSSGLLNIGIIILLPISPKDLIVLRDPILFNKTDKILFSNRATAINCLNRLQAITFDKRLMFFDKTQEVYVNDLITKTEVDRESFINTGKGGCFPGPKDVMIVTHFPTLLPNYPYIFSSIKKEYRHFKFYDTDNCRVESKKYLDRLNTLLPFASKKFDYAISIYEISKYKEFILSYWKEHKQFESCLIVIDKEQEFKNVNMKDECGE